MTKNQTSIATFKGLLATSIFSLVAFTAGAQFGPGTPPGTTVTNDNVGIGLTSPTAKLHIISGYTSSGGGPTCYGCIPPPPCSYTGQPALTIQWTDPNMSNQTATNGCTAGPDIIQVFNQTSGYTGFPPTMTTTTRPYFWMNASGKTGIGMYPQAGKQFSVGGYSYLNGNTQVTMGLRVGNTTPLTNSDWAPVNFPYTFSVDNGDANFAGNAQIAGNVRIGATQPINAFASYRLGVDGDIVCKRMVVEINDWADFVFDKNYKLPSLASVEAFITQNKHLPDVPSAATVAKDGLSVGEMEATLLKKIEELTLYTIQLEKRLKDLEAKRQ